MRDHLAAELMSRTNDVEREDAEVEGVVVAVQRDWWSWLRWLEEGGS